MNDSRSARLPVPAGVGVLLLLQLVVLYLPSAPEPPAPVPHADKVVHALVFAAPVLLAGLGQRQWWPLVALLCVLHAPVSEVLQHVFLPTRSGAVGDVVADLAGTAVASIGVLLWLRRPRRRRP